MITEVQLLLQAKILESETYEELEFFGDRILYILYIHDTYKTLMNGKGLIRSGRKVRGKYNRIINDKMSNSTFISYMHVKGLKRFILYKPEEGYEAKAKADVFEAIFGAIAVDSDWDWKVLDKTYKRLTSNEVRGKGLLKRIETGME